MTIAVFDVDDTLGDFVTYSLPIFNRICKANLTYKDISTPAFHKLLNISPEDVAEIIVSEKILENIPPLPNAINSLKRCKELGLTPAYCTSRGFHPYAQLVTFDWLESHDAPEGSILVTNFNQSKADAINSAFGNIKLFVDDNSHHIHDVSSKLLATNVVMINRPWNTDSTHTSRVSCISEIFNFLG